MERFEDKDGRRWYAEDIDKYSIGECYSSVTTILETVLHHKLKEWFINTPASMIKKFSSNAASEGSDIHDAIAKEAMGDYSFRLDPKHEKALDHWLRLKKTHNIKAINVEQTVANPDYGYAGTYDILAEFDGKVSIIDIKTGSNYPVTCGWQMAAYAKALEKKGEYKDLGYVGLHIKRDGSYGKEWVYEHKDFCFKAFMATWYAWKGLYWNELKRMNWKWLAVDPLEINGNLSKNT